MAAAKPSLGRVFPGSSILFLCDMQEKFRHHIAYFPQIVSVAARMLRVAQLLEVPALLTEQYPEGLGPTVPELGAEGLRPLTKTCFSMVPALQQELDSRRQLRSVLLCGIETQACILPGGPAGGAGPNAAERCLPLHQRRAHSAARERCCPPQVQGDLEAYQGACPGQWTAEPLPRPELPPPMNSRLLEERPPSHHPVDPRPWIPRVV
ncbi:isochorismatase domain-containing protein 2 isoform X1 [Microcebus murinus]|uniref:isochorismatase domain-containing protein 2 isoform X1 n=1 Tax=Microcebus murinus TaxID=30608 RepID=UPI003F6D0834